MISTPSLSSLRSPLPQRPQHHVQGLTPRARSSAPRDSRPPAQSEVKTSQPPANGSATTRPKECLAWGGYLGTGREISFILSRISASRVLGPSYTVPKAPRPHARCGGLSLRQVKSIATHDIHDLCGPLTRMRGLPMSYPRLHLVWRYPGFSHHGASPRIPTILSHRPLQLLLDLLRLPELLHRTFASAIPDQSRAPCRRVLGRLALTHEAPSLVAGMSASHDPCPSMHRRGPSASVQPNALVAMIGSVNVPHGRQNTRCFLWLGRMS